MGAKSCPRCGVKIQGYVDECPACGFEKPVPLPWYIYGIMLVIFLLSAWLFIDLEAVARALLTLREAVKSG